MEILTAQKADIHFWVGFYGDTDCCDWASKKAYLDMNRTMTFPRDDSKDEKTIKKERQELVDKGTKIIRDRLGCLTEEFDSWHGKTCDRLIECYGGKLQDRKTKESTSLTYGQAQKWLNMTLKYLWLLDRVGFIADDDIHQFIQKNGDLFHVPLDSYILRYAAKQSKKKKESFDLDNGLKGFDCKTHWGDFNSTWSQITEAEKYLEYQQALRSAIQGKTPLEWELEHWHKALGYYDHKDTDKS